ncbi:MAG: type I DNA topoisomerase [bacterium]|nr:type I DNA topoisomerase [bacterium]
MSKLVIVESPAKAKTIKKYLGKDYEVVASMGHVRDLPKSKLGIDVDNNFKPQYVDMSDKKKVVSELKKQAAKSDAVYLATDPDREGEAISWHLAQILGLDIGNSLRVEFNEITKTGVKNGMANPHKINLDLVDSQQARRVLDRLVGYKLSPFLWKKIKSGLSAGRVQTVALRLIVDREREIKAFVEQEYWTVDAQFCKSRSTFDAAFYGKSNGDKIEIQNQQQADEIVEKLKECEFFVSNVKKGVRNKQPSPPFITSTLQQEASRKLGFTGQRTMRAAQQLYEGVEIESIGTLGLITYMRTDSLRISDEARAAGNKYIKDVYGDKYLPKTQRYFKTKKNIQDAHEAIRPTTIELTPEKIKGSLTADQFKLYKLIWERFIASLMAACVQDTMSVDITGGDYLLRASGFNVRFNGFTVLYVEGKDVEDKDSSRLPELSEGDKLNLKSVKSNQHFTQPPMRYTEPTLIKAMDDLGIGRPSTYVPIIMNILQREYIEREKKQLKSTLLGETVCDLMVEHFKKIFDVKFTASLESSLDKIEAGQLDWVNTIGEFYKDFESLLKKAEETTSGVKIKVPDVETDVVCENCGRKMVIKSGRFGKFLACPAFPECRNTKPIVTETKGNCPVCGGKVLLKKSKTGHKYYGCENAPKCKFMTWDEPVSDVCPKCSKTLFKKRGGILHCLGEGCDYEIEVKKKNKVPKE